MKRFFKKPKTVGHAPGSLIPKEKSDLHPLILDLFKYGPEQTLEESTPDNLIESIPFDPQVPVNWLNINGSHEVDHLEEIGKRLNIQPLVLEDILNTSQRPKVEDYDE